MVANRGSVILLLMATACMHAGCIHAPLHDQPHQVEDCPDEPVWKRSRVAFRKVALAFFCVPLYQLPDGYSSSYRRHLVAHELSPVVLGQKKKSGAERLASWSQPQSDQSAESGADLSGNAKSRESETR